MFKTQHLTLVALATVAGLSATSAIAQINIPTVPIGNPGNAPDVNGLGSVAYIYNIGATEVTNAQYIAFLNAVAATDTYGLYSPGITGAPSGMTRSGSAGSYTYAAADGQANKPVNFVSFWDAARFANWLHNGQPTGPQVNSTTEDGAYTLTVDGISAGTVSRNPNWKWAVTSANEWYKAAYHQPASQGGDSDDYWLYPTSSNTITTADANYGRVFGAVTTVGRYSPNFYGVYDMAGNLSEWNDGLYTSTSRRVRGDSWATTTPFLPSNSAGLNAFFQGITVGFRVVMRPAPACPADVVADGSVDGSDFVAFINSFAIGDVTVDPAADLDHDGTIDGNDFVAFINAFGVGC